MSDTKEPEAHPDLWTPLEKVLKYLHHPDFYWGSHPFLNDLKYVELRIDTRDLHCLIKNRNGGGVCPADIRKAIEEADPKGMNENSPSGWLPIETAPKDGTKIIGLGQDWGNGPPHIHITKFYDENWWGRGEDQIRVRLLYLTHWMPLPELPHQP